MRMMKKVMTGMSLTAAALVIAGGVNAVNADAAEATFKAAEQTMTVNGDGVEVLVSFDAIKSSKTGLTWNEKAKWDVYDGDEAVVDLSALKTTKDVYITVKDNTAETPVVYHLAPDTTKLAGKYEVASGVSKLTFTDNKAALDTSKVTLEYRTQNSSTWTQYKEANFAAAMAMYEQQGATLYFRKKAVNLTVTEGEETEGAAYVMNEVTKGYFATAEVKVKITKMGNAPAATFDYDNGVIKAKKGTEYRFIDNSGAFVVPTDVEDAEAGDFAPAPADLKIAIKDVSKNGIFEIRTAADKKVASKIGIYAYKGVATPKANDIANGVSEENGVTAKAKGLNLTYGVDKKGNNQVTFENTNDDVTYLVYAENPAENAKAKAVATVKSAANKGKAVTVAASKLPNGTTLYIMTASDKKTGTFRSKAYSGVTIAYPGASEED